jgi:hypothetical protein
MSANGSLTYAGLPTELLKPTAALRCYSLYSWSRRASVGLAIGPLNGPATDLADGQLGVVIAERTSGQVVGHEEGVAVAVTSTSDKLVDRVEVTT